MPEFAPPVGLSSGPLGAVQAADRAQGKKGAMSLGTLGGAAGAAAAGVGVGRAGAVLVAVTEPPPY